MTADARHARMRVPGARRSMGAPGQEEDGDRRDDAPVA
jgi:hypothetical protein